RRDEQRLIALLFQPERELAGQRRLTGALKTSKQDDRRRLLGEPQATGIAAEDRDEFLVDDLDDLLCRVERLRHLGTAGALLDGGDELLDNRQRDIGLE